MQKTVAIGILFNTTILKPKKNGLHDRDTGLDQVWEEGGLSIDFKLHQQVELARKHTVEFAVIRSLQ